MDGFFNGHVDVIHADVVIVCVAQFAQSHIFFRLLSNFARFNFPYSVCQNAMVEQLQWLLWPFELSPPLVDAQVLSDHWQG